MTCPSTNGCDRDCATCEYLNNKVEVILCRDCKYSCSGSRYCSRDAYDETEWLHIEPSGFCAWAEKVG